MNISSAWYSDQISNFRPETFSNANQKNKGQERIQIKILVNSIIDLIICLVFIPKTNRAFLKNLFSDKCINYQQVYSRKLNDRIVDYSSKARLTGITALINENDIRQSVIRREIVKVRNGRNYKVENLTNSYPYLTRESKKLLKKTWEKIQKKDLN